MKFIGLFNLIQRITQNSSCVVAEGVIMVDFFTRRKVKSVRKKERKSKERENAASVEFRLEEIT